MQNLSSAPPSADQLLQLWQRNAGPWGQAVRSGSIESRRLATDQAVVDAVLRCQPQRVLDVGCGEGWLTRVLAGHSVGTRGVDAIPQLVAQAAALHGDGDYVVATLADLAASPLGDGLADGFDLWVCNFSLFHADDAPALLTAARQRLVARAASAAPGAALVIQTLHANATPGGAAQPDGWQPGGWGACGGTQGGGGFAEPIPWYFRGLATWQALFADHGFTGVDVAEPTHPGTGAPLSWVFTAQVPQP